MNGFDLVPADYRQQLAQRLMLRYFGFGAMSLFLILGGCYLGLIVLQRQADEGLVVLKNQQQQIQQQIQTYQGLRQQHQHLQQQLSQLTALSQAGATSQVLASVEAAAAEQSIWLNHWHYDRATTTNQLHRVELNGNARDHGELANFVQQLLRSPAITDARILAANIRAPDNSGSQKNVQFRLQLQVVGATS